MDLAALGDFIKAVGVNVAMLVACAWWIVRKDTQAREDAKAAVEFHQRMVLEQRDAYLASLDKVTARIESNTHSLDELGGAIRDLRRSA